MTFERRLAVPCANEQLLIRRDGEYIFVKRQATERDQTVDQMLFTEPEIRWLHKVAGEVVAEIDSEKAPERAPYGVLSQRELTVLDLLVDGWSNKEVGDRLGVSFHTVKFHLVNIMRKLGARTRAQAAAMHMANKRERR